MIYDDIFKEIKNKQISNLYLFCGEEIYVMNKAVEQIKGIFLKQGNNDLNLTIIDGTQATSDEIINACETLPIFADKRLVLIKDISLLSTGKQVQDEIVLKKYLKDVPKYTCTIFICQKPVDKRRGFFKTLKKEGKIVEFNVLSHEQQKKWVSGALKKDNKIMTPEVMDYFITITSDSLDDINNEIQKLVSLSDDRVITKEMVESMVTPSIEHTIFELVEAVGLKQTEKAVYLLSNLISAGQSPFAILPMIARQFRIIYLSKNLYSSGLNKKNIASRVRIQPFVVSKCLRQANYHDNDSLVDGLRHCSDLDVKFKTGEVEPHTALELLIIKLSS